MTELKTIGVVGAGRDGVRVGVGFDRFHQGWFRS